MLSYCQTYRHIEFAGQCKGGRKANQGAQKSNLYIICTRTAVILTEMRDSIIIKRVGYGFLP